MDYKAYLKSQEWQIKRKFVLDFYDNRCAVCGSSVRIDVHHRSYYSVGDEHLNDLIALCHHCHSLFHEKTNPTQVFGQIESLLKSIPK